MTNEDHVGRQIIETIDEASPALNELSRYIHSNPEIALQEVKASAACADLLEANGFEVERGVAGLPTAFKASARNGNGPVVAFLAEYDALPGLGHGCGHNLIALAAVGAGLGLASVIERTGGQVVVFGTPAEEAVGGKVIMAEQGLFEGVDVALGSHPADNEAYCPTVEGSGRALACQALEIEFTGQSAHAAADPYNGVNALDGLILTFTGINALRQHVKSDARIHGIVTRGGQAPNIIPDDAAGLFFVRAATRDYMNVLIEKVRAIADGAGAMTGATVKITFPERATFDMITNHTLARAIQKHNEELGLEMRPAAPEEPMGSTDWGNVSYLVPSVETTFPIVQGSCTWHSQDVVEASVSELGMDNALKTAKALALAGLDVLQDQDLLNAVRSEFEASIARVTSSQTG
jgi:amidohydrolase